MPSSTRSRRTGGAGTSCACASPATENVTSRRHRLSSSTSPRGVLGPVITPFTDDLRPDAERLARHFRWLIAQDVGLAVFGTNSEANSMSVPEKRALLDHLVEAGLPPARMMPGTGCCAL